MARITAAAAVPVHAGTTTNGGARPEALVQSYRRVAEVFHDVMSEQSLDALLDRIADTLAELMPYDALHIYEADDARRELVPVFARSPDYQEEIFQVEANVSWARTEGKRDPLFAKAAHTVAAEGRAAASLLQRKLAIGYTRAARLVDQLAEHRIIGPYEGSKSRDVLMDVIQVDQLLADLGEE